MVYVPGETLLTDATKASARWLLTDFGGVLSLHQSDEDSRTLAAMGGMEWPLFKERYWLHRSDYDRADLSPTQYWELVLQRSIGGDELRDLVAMDTETWTKPNQAVLDAYRSLGNGQQIALLSNAPTPLARAIPTLPWMPQLEAEFYSCDLRLTKPDPRIYLRVVSRLGTSAAKILLVDDRRENIQAAEDLGLMTELYTSPDSLKISLNEFGRQTSN